MDFEGIPYCIRIGVTGHRRLEDASVVEATVRQALDAEVEGLFSPASLELIRRVRPAGTSG